MEHAAQQYDGIVIGSGQGGKPLALALAEAGWKTALVERNQIGGTCINYGCTPTKTMVASGRVAYLAKRAKDYGVSVGKVEMDMVKVRQRQRAIVQNFREGSERRVRETAGLDFLHGEAVFFDSKTLDVRLDDGQI